MKKYDYRKAMEQDVRQYMEDCQMPDFFDKDDLMEKLYDEMFTADSVTGNASGSYTFNRAEAKENVLANIDLLKEAYEEYGMKDRFATHFFDEDYETMDVIIRCYILGSVLADVIDEQYEKIEQ